MWDARLDEAQAEIKFARRNINNFRYADDTTLMAESRGTKEPLDEGEIEKAGLKLNIQKTKIMASSPIIPWQIDRETKETVRDFIFLSYKITADGDRSHEMKKMLSLWKKSYDKPRQHIKKQRHYFGNKRLYSQSFAFPVVMYRCDSWTIKKAECQRIDALNHGAGEDS